MTPSAASRIIARLEDHLGARLFQRTTRRLSLTEAGMAFCQRAEQILADLAEAEAEVAAHAVHPRGILRITAPVVFGRLHLPELLAELAARHPELGFHVDVTDRFVDLIDEGYDLAIRIGALADSQLIARRLCTNRRILVASPGYLAKNGVPQNPSALAAHRCLVFTALERPREWRLFGPGGVETVTVKGEMASSNGEMISEWAKSGAGIGLGATFSIYRSLASGELVRVLPDYAFEPTSMFAVYPSARQLSTKVRVVIDALAKRFSDPAPWDRDPG